ncbi:MAG TPA: phospholipase A2 [Jiangellaceae bacterium]
MLARLGLALAAIAAAFAMTGAGFHQPETDGPENRAAARAVAVFTGLADGDPATAIPADFGDVMGYDPVVLEAPDRVRVPVKPAGECSSAFGATTFDFNLACEHHDLGYDLLRYAARTGGELGPWARRAIDDRLAAMMHEQCTAIDGGPACRTVAWISEYAVRANSWRQGQGVPVPETGAPYLVAAGLIGAAVAGPPLAGRLRARRRRSAVAVTHPGASR